MQVGARDERVAGEGRAAAPRIEPAPTGVTGFVGTFPAGPVHRPTTVHSTAEFLGVFGTVGAATDTSIAVQDFFANGGARAVVVSTGVATDSSSVAELVAGLSLLQPRPGEVPSIQLLCIPTMARRTKPFSQKLFQELVLRVTGFCVQHRIFLLVDPNTAGDEIADIDSWRRVNPSWGSSNSALYFPRLHTPASRAAATGRPVAASGAVAGVMARTDSLHGVWKAPAGQEASIGAVVATAISDHEQSPLNRHGINTIRRLGNLGTVIWGARTGGGTIGDEFRYVPVRRTALFLEHSLHHGLRWAVFEPNDEPLWAQVVESITNFLNELWRQGAFQGSTPAEAFSVRCDRTTMSRVDLRRGRTVVQIGFAPLKPAEFVVLRLVLEGSRP